MKLLITTPTAVIVEQSDVVAVQAEDETGRFGILPGHTDFLTVLSISILRWRDRNGKEGYCALRGGVLTVIDGTEVMVASREAVVGEHADELEQAVLARFHEAVKNEQEARVESTRLQTMALRRIIQYLRPSRAPILGPPS